MRFFIRRILIILVGLIIVNFASFSYAHYARPLRAAHTPYSRISTQVTPLLPAYSTFIKDISNLNFNQQLALPASMRDSKSVLGETIWQAVLASLGLLAIALLLSILLGMVLGLYDVRLDPPRVSPWLTFFSTTGLAMPSFYIGSLAIMFIISYVLWRGPGAIMPLPIGGMGWDAHLVLPVLALMARPTVQVARVTSGLLVSELGEQYVVAARSLGYSWRMIRNSYALRNIIAPVILTVAGMVRFLVSELVLVEWLFRWPGLGRLLAWTLVPAQLSSSTGSPLFLNPQVLSILITLIAALFLITDFIAALLVRVYDPRLRSSEAEIQIS